jgi:hypothetical protein
MIPIRPFSEVSMPAGHIPSSGTGGLFLCSSEVCARDAQLGRTQARSYTQAADSVRGTALLCREDSS